VGGRVELAEDGFAVDGSQVLRRNRDCGGDHRIATAAAVRAPAFRRVQVRVSKPPSFPDS
jgi:5-enolpyruvylshikimate-3-phosphate synthase